MTQLVRVITPQDPALPVYAHHPHEGMIICIEHLRQIDCDPTVDALPADQVAFWGHRCLMCGVEAVADRLCRNDRCAKPLHPQWPAVYCCNGCAMEDA